MNGETFEDSPSVKTTKQSPLHALREEVRLDERHEGLERRRRPLYGWLGGG